MINLITIYLWEIKSENELQAFQIYSERLFAVFAKRVDNRRVSHMIRTYQYYAIFNFAEDGINVTFPDLPDVSPVAIQLMKH